MAKEEEEASLPPPQLDEYDVVLPKMDDDNGGGGQFRVQRTKQGETIFWDYKRLKDGSKGPAERYQWFRNQGDIFLAVDGVSTNNKSFTQVMEMMRKSWSNRGFSCFRMRNIKYQDTVEQTINLPLQRKIQSLEHEISTEEALVQEKEREIALLEQDLEVRKQVVQQHKLEIGNKRAEIKSLHQEELKKKQGQVLELQQKLAAVETDVNSHPDVNSQPDANEQNHPHDYPDHGEEIGVNNELVTMVEAIPPPDEAKDSTATIVSSSNPGQPTAQSIIVNEPILTAIECNPFEESSREIVPIAARKTSVDTAVTGLTSESTMSENSQEDTMENNQHLDGSIDGDLLVANVDSAVAYLLHDAIEMHPQQQPSSPQHFVFEEVEPPTNKSRTLMCPRPSLFSKKNKAMASKGRASQKGGKLV